MDTLYWNNLKSSIIFYNTSKQYFGRHLWRMACHADGGRLLLRNKKWSIEEAFENRQKIQKHGFSRYWLPRHSQDSLDFNIPLLKSIENIKQHYGTKIQMRIEEPMVQFYVEDEQTLKDIAGMLDNVDCIKDITGPANNEEAKLLKTGVILTHTEVDHNYKIVFRDGRYSHATKQQILNYLESLGDEVRITPGCRDMLLKEYPSLWNVYFFARDPKISMFLNLIDPNLVSNIHELVPVNNKY